MPQLNDDWPDDADGGVFRRLVEHGFDFSKPHSVNYNIDFMSWPPSGQAVALLKSMYGQVSLYDPDEHGDGYAQFKVHSQLTYEGVTSVQRTATSAMEPFGGVCQSWGVLQGAG